ncbi:MAG TPA: flagellar basal body rod protein FlgB [Nevskia sp.]|nr:flagellar basal body rod protein FlgB [Nevskia sp.]
MANLDPLFGMHAQSLAVQRQRMEVLAANIANADTPHYQARDIDFAKVLASQQQAAASAPAGAAPAAAAPPPLVYRVPLQPSVDGNTVDEQVEQGAFADAAMHYQASLSFLNGEVKGLLTAITGS